MHKRHWILGNETHYGRGYFSFVSFGVKSHALREAAEWGLTASEVAQLSKFGRLELPLARAKELSFIAVELVLCTCTDPAVHDDF